MSEATLYRAIRGQEFPALRIRGRYVVPSKAIDELEAAALSSSEGADLASWDDSEGRVTGRDRGAAPVAALLGFAAFLAVSALLMRVPAAGFYLVTVFVLVAAVVFVRVTRRRERQLNKDLGRAFDASQPGFDEWLESRGEESGAAR